MAFSPADLRCLLPSPAPGQTLWVGLSGGLDSTVLLHALAALQLPVRLRAIHVNHQISPHADEWEAACAAFCQRLGVAFAAERVLVEKSGRGLEDAARAVRYRVFEQCLQAGDWLCSAHHADDQSETLLLRLLRGAGPRGLAAMAQERPLGRGRLLRPLLGVNRAELEHYAHEQQLTWVEDESNRNTDYDRNYLRQSLIPLLRQRWPTFNQRLGLTAQLCAETEGLLEDLAAQDLMAADPLPARLGESLDLTAVMSLNPSRRHNLLRYWLRRQGLEVPEQGHQQQIEQQLESTRPDAGTCIAWGRQSLRVYRQRLYALPRLEPVNGWPQGELVLAPGESQRLRLPDDASLTLTWSDPHEQDSPGEGARLRGDIAALNMTWRQGGERCRPHGRAHSQSLKKLLQEQGLEPWWRDRIPLLHIGGELAAVGDLWVCQGFAAAPGEPGYRLRWQPGGAV